MRKAFDQLLLYLYAFIMASLMFRCSSVADADENESFEKKIAPALKKYCAECHGTGDQFEADVDLLSLGRLKLADQTELIQRVAEVLEFEEMPPSDSTQPQADEREALVLELKRLLNRLVSKEAYPPTPIRRMNRFQYNNAVVDLFELNCIVFTLPERIMREHNGYFKPATGSMADMVTVGNRPLGKSQMIEPRLAGVAAFPQDLRAEHGFDNRADHLSLSPLLLESFLNLGRSITQSPDFHAKNVGIWNQFFSKPPADVPQAAEVRERLGWFLDRAFRGNVEEDLLDRYTRFVNRQLEEGTEFSEAMKSVAAAAIASPKFFYLYETDGLKDGMDVQVVDDFELASRLSFFLWGSIPDSELTQLAAANELNNTKVLTSQVERMLGDRKVKRFCDSFPSQWLQLDRIVSALPDPDKYPTFYYSKYRNSMHMMLEPLLIFETVLIEDLPITQFIDSDFTYRSHLLDEAYGELASGKITAKKKGGNVTVLRFYRLPVTDRRVGGMITNAAVMTMTSGPVRTKPITRGAWIASVVFNNPPAPPPADVPPLDENPSGHEANLTLRERLKMHRERADCRGCHEKIDPLGFALENYDAVGIWRDQYENERDVDMSGRLFRQQEFSDVIEFKDAILAEKRRFARGFASHLLSFALARELSAADQPALDRITDATVSDDYKFKTLIKQIVLSEPFRSKSNQPVGNAESNQR